MANANQNLGHPPGLTTIAIPCPGRTVARPDRRRPGVRAVLVATADLRRAVDPLKELSSHDWDTMLTNSAHSRDVMRHALDPDDAITGATSADDVDTSKPAADLV